MKITNLAVDNKTSVFVLIAIIIIQGIIAYTTLPREAAPDITIPLVIVSTPYIGVSPKDIETLITQPIEKEINAIGDVKEIRSSSFEGYSVIRVEFESGYDIDDALDKVREKVDKAKPELPADAEEPEILEINFSEFPIMTINISGDVSLVRLKDLAEELQDDFEKITGVLEAKISGGMEREVQVNVDIAKMYHYNVRFDDIISAINNENRTIPGGNIDVNESSFLVRIPGEFTDPYLISDIIVKMNEGKPIYVKDLAEVEYDFKKRDTYARLDGTDAVAIEVSKRSGENVIRIADEVKEILEKKKSTLPGTITVELTTDYSEDIKQQVRELENNIFSGLVLVVAVLFFFLGVRNAFFVAIAIPLSMLLSFIILQAMDITLNFVVLFALILALGMLVDNAIVIVENIYKFLEEGHSRFDAAKLATAEVAWPVATSTLTTVAAFFSLLFWPGIVGDFMSFIPLTVIITLLSSLFVALIINPVIAGTFMKLEKKGEKPTGIFDKMLIPFNKVTYFFTDRMLPKTLDTYERMLRFSLGPRRDTKQRIHVRNLLAIVAIPVMFMIEGALASILPEWAGFVLTTILGAGVVLIFTNNRLRFLAGAFFSLIIISQVYFAFDHGVEFFPETQPERIFANIELPIGTNIERTNEIVKDIEKQIIDANIYNIESISTSVGTSNNPFDAGSSTPNKSTITVQYIEYEDRNENSMVTTERIRQILLSNPGVAVTIEMQQAGPPVGLPVNIELSGEDLVMLGKLTDKLKERISSVPGLVDLDDDYDPGKPELRIDVDREKAALYGVSTVVIANAVRTAINGTEASKYRVGEDEYDITVRLKEEQRSSIEDLKNLKVVFNNKQGKTLQVPLLSVANVYQSTGPGAVRRIDLDRVITISGDAAEGYNENVVLDSVRNRLADFALPPGYYISYTGASEFQEESQEYLTRAFGLGILLIFMILVIQFNSLSQPFIIMSAVVISLVGVFIGLIAYALPFGIIMTGIGIISLAGVVVNNNIVLIDYMNKLRVKGMSRRDAVVRAGLRRFRPVTLTAITTVLGLIPLSFGFGFDISTLSFQAGGESAEFWRSMGIAVIFGLIFATFLTLIIVPVIYSTLEDIPPALKQMFKFKIFWGVKKGK